jgi:pseudouridine-5'-phosphate glycosidase/pseudouridine kinase
MSGLHFANPIPSEHAIPRSEMDQVIAQALKDAQLQGITGKDNTPFILSRIKELTKGKSVAVNAELVTSNVIRGAKVAVELANMARQGGGRLDVPERTSPAATTRLECCSSKPHRQEGAGAAQPHVEDRADILVAGSIAIDTACNHIPSRHSASLASVTPQLHTSEPARISQTLGGVGYNITRAAGLVGASVRLCSAVGDDFSGRVALQMMQQSGLPTSNILMNKSSRTAQYVAMNDAKKDLVAAMADMEILESTSTASQYDSKQLGMVLSALSPRYLAIDSNWSAPILHQWLSSANSLGIRVALEPVSVAKSKRWVNQSSPLDVFPQHHISLSTPNLLELSSMHEEAHRTDQFERSDWWAVIDALGISSAGARGRLVQMTNSSLVDRGVPQKAIQLLPFIPCLLTKLGADGVLLTQLLKHGDWRLSSPDTARYILSRSTSNGADAVGGVYMRMFAPAEVVPEEQMVSVNGVGDTFLGILLAGLCQDNTRNVEDLVDIAQRGSVMTLKSDESVHPGLGQLMEELRCLPGSRPPS